MTSLAVSCLTPRASPVPDYVDGTHPFAARGWIKDFKSLRLTSESGVATRETTAAKGTAPPLEATDAPAAPPSPSATVVGVPRGEGVVSPTSSAGVAVGVAAVSAARSLPFVVAR